jgi:hypothetical protein
VGGAVCGPAPGGLNDSHFSKLAGSGIADPAVDGAVAPGAIPVVGYMAAPALDPVLRRVWNDHAGQISNTGGTRLKDSQRQGSSGQKSAAFEPTSMTCRARCGPTCVRNGGSCRGDSRSPRFRTWRR